MNILLIEDEAFSAMIMLTFLRDAGHEVIHAVNADEAVASLKTVIPQIVISDWSIDGDGSAADAIRAVRAVNKDVKVAFVTGHSRDALFEQLAPLEPYTFYTKPINFEALVKDLESAST